MTVYGGAFVLSFFWELMPKLFFTVSYVTNVSSFAKPLTSEEEAMYIKKCQTGDMNARNILIEHNIRLILYIVSKKFWNNEYDKEELVSIGSIGLIKAANTFDIGKKTRFSTYASRCIINEILMYLKNEKKYPQTESLNESVYKYVG